MKKSLAFAIVLAAACSSLQAQNPIIPDGAKLEKLFTRTADIEGGLTEGPAMAPDGSVYFSDIPFGEDKGQILRYDPKTGKTTVFTDDSRKSNGLSFDADGYLVAAEGADFGGRAVVRYDVKTGKRTVIADSYKGMRFNAPNDLCIDPEGRIYFSDPRYLGNEERELMHRAVYRIELDGSVTEVTHDCEKPNGIALAPDCKTLYVADHNNGTDKIGSVENPKPGAMRIYAFPLGPNGLPNGSRRTLQDYGEEAGCDGMCVDSKGNVYLTLRSLKRPGISVLNPKGKEIAFLPTGPANQSKENEPVGLPSNVEFGFGAARNTLYVTIDKSLYRINLKVPGYQVPFIDQHADRNWERINIDREFRSEGVAVGDLNGDGRNDVVAGDVWYEAPKNPGKGQWKMHGFRPVGKFVAGVGYSNSFCNYVYDFDQDGLQDICVVGFPGAPFHWYRNPGKASDKWAEHEIWSSICNESPDFTDLDGDGKPEFVFGSQPEARMGFSPVPKGDVTKKWDFHFISEKGDPHRNGTFKYYHGLGVGDLNGDGRSDLLITHGFWTQPENAKNGAWKYQPYALAKDGVNPERLSDIYVDDLDMDGDNDLIGSSAHAFGVWWFENVGSNKKPQFKAHTIQESNSQTHAMEYVDINGDGQRDIVTGKRFYAHNGGDPGARDVAMMYWFEVKRSKNGPKFIAHEIVAGRNTGIGTQFQAVDFNGDGKVDIALSNKKGVNLLLQK